MLFSIFLQFHICSSDATTLDESSNNSSYLVFTKPSVYSFILPPGRYKITCYGAQGGWSHCGGSYGNAGGKGALVSGYINVTEKDQMFFAIVGGMGGSSPKGSSGGGYNGGGFGGWCKKFKRGLRKKQRSNGPGGGGGATEIRITSNDLSNRIIVAAGGSGASYNIQGAPGGNLTGFNSYGPSDRTTQTSGNENGIGSGGNNAKWFPSSGAGGGYRGGSGGYASDSNAAVAVSDSGSSYISGFPGCKNHPEVLLDSGEMQIGVKEGNGYIQIDQEYKCPPNCTSCSGPFQCKICDSHFRLYDGMCYSSCPIGSIDRVTYCEKCDPSCQSCSEIPTNCTSCHDDYYLYNEKCLDACPDGTLEYDKKCKESCPLGTYTKGEICDECNISCKECVDNPNKCTDCPDEKYLFNNECIDKCPERTVRDGNKCVTECGSNQFLYHDICYSQCPKGTFKKGIICEECELPCSECSDNPNKCIQCADGMYLFNSKCVDNCPDDYYSYNRICVENCSNNTFINGKECVNYCPKGKFAVDMICENCDSSCASCENMSSLCTKCNKDTFLYNNQCMPDCANGTFKYQNECVNICPSGSYLVDDICQNAFEYYGDVELHQKAPMVSKAVGGGVIALLIAFMILEISYLVWLSCHNKLW